MLRKIRITLAIICSTLITLLFLDFTGTIHTWFGWLAKVQFLPALLAVNLGVITGIVAMTFLSGRIYCSVICPLGVMQDVFGWLGKQRKKNRYTYSRALSWLRLGMLAVMLIAIVTGTASMVALIAPYSSYGRIVSNLFAPLWLWGNNLLAYFAERMDSYAFYPVDIWIKSTSTLAVTIVFFIVLAVLAWRNGRTYCNTVCPVGTVLGFLSRYSLFKPWIDTGKCVDCNICARTCKAACIDIKHHKIDYSRCVACMDCLDTCRKQAISYKWMSANKKEAGSRIQDNVRRLFIFSRNIKNQKPGQGMKTAGTTSNRILRRKFLSLAALLAVGPAVRSQEKKTDGGLAVITDKKIPGRTNPVVPPGARSLRNMATHCTGCQLCVTVCTNGVLRPSGKLASWMQPEMSFERGYCRPECTKCSEVCPSGAILKISPADKSAVQVGHAVWVKKNCVPLTDGIECGNCARHCPVEAITMIPSDPVDTGSPKVPAVNIERCIGCGACENLCPARPFSAIYVEGHVRHRII